MLSCTHEAQWYPDWRVLKAIAPPSETSKTNTLILDYRLKQSTIAAPQIRRLPDADLIAHQPLTAYYENVLKVTLVERLQ